MIELTDEQRQELKLPEPLALDPLSRATSSWFGRKPMSALKSLLDLSDYEPDEGASEINEIMASDDANDPLLESYQRYRKLT